MKYLRQGKDKRFQTGDIKIVPVGVNQPGWLQCGGGVANRNKQSNLFNVIGTTYGTGNGITTFNLPDLNSKPLFTNSNIEALIKI